MLPEPTSETQVEFTPEFKRCLRTLAKRYPTIRSDLEPLIAALQSGERPGDQVGGVGYAVVKARAPNSDARRGRSGGYRVVYWVAEKQRVVLLTLYSKSDQADVSIAQLRHVLRAWEQDQPE